MLQYLNVEEGLFVLCVERCERKVKLLGSKEVKGNEPVGSNNYYIVKLWLINMKRSTSRHHDK